MNQTVPATEVRRAFGKILNWVVRDRDTVTITNYGRPCARIVPLYEVEQENQADEDEPAAE